jgi:acetyl esterase/lipase
LIKPRPKAWRRAAPAAALWALAASLGGCSGIATLNALEPSGGVTTTTDVAFRPGERGKLDIYRPAASAQPAPVVVFFYGGAWDQGRRQDYRFVGLALARRGFLTVIPDYRVYPEVRWPAFLQDSAEAVRWARDHAADYGGAPQRLFLMGHSAGAYNAVSLATDRRWLHAVGLDPTRDLGGVVGLAGPYDFLPLHTDELKAIFGPEAQRPDTQPINHVDGKEPPFFLGVDTGDKVVDPGNTSRFAAKVRAAGGSVDVREYKGLSHALLVGAIAAPLRLLAPVLADASAFIKVRAETRP